MQMQHRESDMIKYSWKKKSNCQFQLSNALRGNINNLKHFFFHVNSYIYAIPIIFSPLVCNVCLFVSLFVWGCSSHSRIFHSWRRQHDRWRAANFNQRVCSGLMAIEQWWFFSVPHLLWHGTLNYCREFGGGVVFRFVAAWIRIPNLPLVWRTLEPTVSPLRLVCNETITDG